MPQNPLLHDLNPAQREAVATLSGPLLVLAGAGSGKTRVVTFRIANLIRHGVRPDRILAVTFTNKAAKEMRERAGALLGLPKQDRPEISTFHSLCLRVLRRHIRRLGYPQQFAIYDRGEQEGVARAALRELRVPGEALRPGDLIQQISRWKSASLRPPDAASLAASDKEHLAAAGYRRYQQGLKLAGAVDFDDLLLLTEELLTHFPAIKAAEAGLFEQILIDEYQDTNAAQYRIVKHLAGVHRNLCVVGDDDQSIYGWRGAEVTHILRFAKDWPNSKVVRLEDNYRSTAPILSLANRLIACNRHRHAKQLRASRQGGEVPRLLIFLDEETEARQVVEEIRGRVETGVVRGGDVAILLRTNEQPRPFEAELRRCKVPYVLVGGMSFYDRTEVRDVLAYLRAVAYPRDEVSLLRIINKPPRGIGPRIVARLMERAVADGRPLHEVMANPSAAGVEGLTGAASAAVSKFCALLDALRKRLEREPPLDVARSVIDQVGYRQELARIYTDPNDLLARNAAVEEVINSLAAYQSRAKQPTLAGFLEDVALAAQEANQDDEDRRRPDAVVLMTLHSAKGLEFPEVYLVGLEEGLLPHRRAVEEDGPAIDEERRLCYVGATRAQNRLTLSFAKSRMKWGKSRPTQPSRFLFELLGPDEHPRLMAAAAPAHGAAAGRAEARAKCKQRRCAKPAGRAAPDSPRSEPRARRQAP